MPQNSIIPIQGIYEPSAKEGYRSVQYAVDLTGASGQAAVNLTDVVQKGQISRIVSMYFDNADNAFAVAMVCNATGQRFFFAPNTQGYIRLLLSNLPELTFFSPSPCTFNVNFLNFYVRELIWGSEAMAGGTVTSVGLAAPAEFTVSGSPVTTAGVLTLNKANQAPNNIWAGPIAGPAAAPSFRTLGAADIPALPYLSPALPNKEMFKGSSANIATAVRIYDFNVFLATGQNNVTGDGTVYNIFFDTAVINDAAVVNLATGLFTAPSNGFLKANAFVLTGGFGAGQTFGQLVALVNGAAFQGMRFNPLNAVDAFGFVAFMGPALNINMNAGDQLQMQLTVVGGAKTVDIFGQAGPNEFTYMTGQFIADAP